MVILVSMFMLVYLIILIVIVLDLIMLNSCIVELGIVILVVIIVFNNVYLVIMCLGFIIFGFGLFYGMGFVSVFGDFNV